MHIMNAPFFLSSHVGMLVKRLGHSFLCNVGEALVIPFCVFFLFQFTCKAYIWCEIYLVRLIS